MRRKVFDVLVSAGGLSVVAMLLVAGAGLQADVTLACREVGPEAGLTDRNKSDYHSARGGPRGGRLVTRGVTRECLFSSCEVAAGRRSWRSALP